MKFKYVYLCCFILFFGCKKDNNSKQISNAKSLNFSVLTYNIAGLPEGLSSSHPQKNTPYIGERINEYDIVQVQEDFNYHEVLLKTDNHKFVTNTKGPVPFGDGLNTLSNYEILDFKRFRWNDCTYADCLTPKGFSFSRINFNDQFLVDFYNIHSNAGSGENEMRARRKNIAQFIKYVDENSGTNPVIIMGDFNSRYTRSGDSIRSILDRNFKDVWVELVNNGNIPLMNDISLLCEEGDGNGPSCEVVDKIYYRSTDKILLTPIFFELPTNKFLLDGKWLSDHRPMAANFIISKK